MVAAGLFALFLAFFFTRGDGDLRARAVRWISPVVAGLAAAGGWPAPSGTGRWCPAWMGDNVPGRAGHAAVRQLARAAPGRCSAPWCAAGPGRRPVGGRAAPVAAAGRAAGPRSWPRWSCSAPSSGSASSSASPTSSASTCTPTASGWQDYPLLQGGGAPAHATYVPAAEVTDDNRVEAGARDVPHRLHPLPHRRGVNARDRQAARHVRRRIRGTGNGQGLPQRACTPRARSCRPFPGTDREAGALADYLLDCSVTPAAADRARRTAASCCRSPADRTSRGGGEEA